MCSGSWSRRSARCSRCRWPVLPAPVPAEVIVVPVATPAARDQRPYLDAAAGSEHGDGDDGPG